MTETMEETRDELDRLGPVDWLVVEFPGADFGQGRVAPYLKDIVDRAWCGCSTSCS